MQEYHIICVLHPASWYSHTAGSNRLSDLGTVKNHLRLYGVVIKKKSVKEQRPRKLPSMDFL